MHAVGGGAVTARGAAPPLCALGRVGRRKERRRLGFGVDPKAMNILHES